MTVKQRVFPEVNWKEKDDQDGGFINTLRNWMKMVVISYVWCCQNCLEWSDSFLLIWATI